MKQILVYILSIVLFSNLKAQNEITKIEDLGEIHTIEFDNKANHFFGGEVLVKHESKQFILSALNHTLDVYDLEGKFIKSIGDAGKGPGEFLYPTSMTINDDKIIVSEFNGQMEIFSTDGIHIETLNIPIMPLSSISALGSEQILVSGKHYKNEITNLMHIYSLKEKKIVKSFFPIPLSSQNYSNIFFSIAKLTPFVNTGEHIYSFFAPLNELYKFDLNGNLISKTEVKLDYFIPIEEKVISTSRQDKMMEYLNSFSRINNIFEISENELIIQYSKSTHQNPISGSRLSPDDFVLSLAIVNNNGDVLYEFDNTLSLIHTEISENKNSLFYIS